MRTIKIDGNDQTVWKADVEKVIPAPTFANSRPLFGQPHSPTKQGRISKLLQLSMMDCRVKLLMSDHSLTYRKKGYLPPEEVSAIDTTKNLLYTASGKEVRANVTKARLSIAEADFVQNAITNAENKDWQKKWNAASKP